MKAINNLPMPANPTEIYTQLTNNILGRYQTNKNKTLLDVYDIHQDFLSLEPGSLEFLFTNREGVINILDDPSLKSGLLELFVNEALQFTFLNNQYIQLNPAQKNTFTQIYQEYLQGIRQVVAQSISLSELERDLSFLVAAHFKRLHQNLCDFFDNEIPIFDENFIFKRVVCSEYSPEFQTSLLFLDPDKLMEPVLDLGCGKTGQLVKYLNGLGIQALGVDRLVEENPNLIGADWFDFNFLSETWGTIISHMAFSNHFLFHHRYKKGHPEIYARQYVKILSSLRPNGAFYYAPGLPFIESLLPAGNFTLKRLKLRKEDNEFYHLLDSETAYTAKVVKNDHKT